MFRECISLCFTKLNNKDNFSQHNNYQARMNKKKAVKNLEL